MSKKQQEICEVCRNSFELQDLYPLEIIRASILKMITKDHPNINIEGQICLNDLQKYQLDRSRHLVELEIGELGEIEKEVISSIESQELLSENINEEYEESLTLGQRVADAISSFGGSWPFIMIFFAFLIGWMFLNSYIFLTDAYDPYPYILLNLILSCLAAIQAPIIMMSQNRRALKERIEAENDYKVNLKAELQIRHLNSKIDHHNKHQWHRLIELQETQMEVMQAIINLQGHLTDNKK